MSSENRKVWDAWGKTPPSKTKHVRVGAREFTSICPYWEMEKATEIFGMAGKGWGWEKPVTSTLFPEQPEFTLLVMELTVWAGERANNITLVNSAQMFQKSGQKLDSEVYKKLLTDTITKALSYFGCASDVFQGRFDDARYVQEARAAETRAAQSPPQDPARAEKLAAIKEARLTLGWTGEQIVAFAGADPRAMGMPDLIQLLSNMQQNIEVQRQNAAAKASEPAPPAPAPAPAPAPETASEPEPAEPMGEFF